MLPIHTRPRDPEPEPCQKVLMRYVRVAKYMLRKEFRHPTCGVLLLFMFVYALLCRIAYLKWAAESAEAYAAASAMTISMPACPTHAGGRMPPWYRDEYAHTRLLHRPPDHPNWPPGHAGPCMALDALYVSGVAPVFSIGVASFNRERQVRTVLAQLLKLTEEPWELVWVDDGSTDKSLEVVLGALDRYAEGWDNACPRDLPDENAAWPDASDAAEHGEIGAECVLSPFRYLVRARVVHVQGTGLLEAFANNLHMRMAHPKAEFFVLLQDDQFMTSLGWNVQLAIPLRAFPDVFSASARCAHGYPDNAGGNLTGARCSRPTAPHEHAWGFYIRDSGNRGPLILRASMTRELGYMDEVTTGLTPIGAADHELNVRAYRHAKWKSGYVPVPYAQYAAVSGLGRSPSTPQEQMLHAQMRVWSAERAARATAGGVPRPPPSNSHDEVRALPPRLVGRRAMHPWFRQMYD